LVLIGSRWLLFGYRFVFAWLLSRSWLRIDVGSCLAVVRLSLVVCCRSLLLQPLLLPLQLPAAAAGAAAAAATTAALCCCS